MSALRVAPALLLAAALGGAAKAQERCQTFTNPNKRVCCPADMTPTRFGCALDQHGDFRSCCVGAGCKPEEICGTGGRNAGNANQCPSQAPVNCGTFCCDSAHPVCCGSGKCCTQENPYCCGDRCCPRGLPYCCPGGLTCAANANGCGPDRCPARHSPGIAQISTSVCCPDLSPYLCNDDSCSATSNCHGVGLKGTPRPGGTGGGGGSSGGSTPFTCLGTKQCSAWAGGGTCQFRSCACATGTSSCVRGWYETNDGRTFACSGCTADCSSAAQSLISNCR